MGLLIENWASTALISASSLETAFASPIHHRTNALFATKAKSLSCGLGIDLRVAQREVRVLEEASPAETKAIIAPQFSVYMTNPRGSGPLRRSLCPRVTCVI
jgi:hypothetical protein